jgi:hypothetical protein
MTEPGHKLLILIGGGRHAGIMTRPKPSRKRNIVLLYHMQSNAVPNGIGTDPINAQHMFMALDGLGKPAALYMYPYEDHGPVAKETIMDQWARWCAWLDMYVKNPKKKG